MFLQNRPQFKEKCEYRWNPKEGSFSLTQGNSGGDSTWAENLLAHTAWCLLGWVLGSSSPRAGNPGQGQLWAFGSRNVWRRQEKSRVWRVQKRCQWAEPQHHIVTAKASGNSPLGLAPRLCTAVWSHFCHLCLVHSSSRHLLSPTMCQALCQDLGTDHWTKQAGLCALVEKSRVTNSPFFKQSWFFRNTKKSEKIRAIP